LGPKTAPFGECRDMLVDPDTRVAPGRAGGTERLTEGSVMTEDEIREAVSDPKCPFTYEELWEMHFGPPGQSISEIIAELEEELRQDGCAPPNLPPSSND
jgi:hypothetical protein